ncbi:MAG: terpene cyclase/mutase family protein [Candidatus Magasanikbacteria bacterium]|nr:terpene cyclase/mutase family protein [Candidatus Magasanikbacteria bacterium]
MQIKNSLGGLKYLVILGTLFWALPALADTTSSTPDINTSTPEMELPTSTPAMSLPTSTLTLRYEDQIIWTGSIELTSTLHHDAINNLDYQLTTNTVFSALVLADQQSDAFTISDAQYNAGYDSFYLACINISPTSTQNACYNWNYVVNNNYPSTGMDKYWLTGGESIYVYFSTPWKISASTTTFPLDTTTTLQTWRYQFDNLSESWVSDENNLVDISIPNPSSTGWWDQTITVTTTQTSASGTVDFKFSATGTYYAKIISLDWTKWSNPITLTVLENSSSTDSVTPPQNGSGSGPAAAVSTSEINNAVQKILNFLKSKQLDNGAIVDLSTSDWSAMSFGANGIYAHDIRTSSFSLYDYLNSAVVTSTTDTLNKCTEYARHILGLLSSGVTKTSSQITELKNKIKDECFSQGVVGQNGINDDIFITLSLLATGEDASNELVQAAVATIKADQQANGAFTWNGWPGQDVTGAAINALKYASTFGAAVDETIFQQAKNYLHTTQLNDGGWGFDTASDPLTTSWAMYGLNALGEGQTGWTNAQNKNPWSVLVNNVNDSGYYQSPWSTDGIDWFATKHSVPALLGKSWPIITSIPVVPAAPASTGSGSNPVVANTSTSAETTSIISTTTIATSTPATTTSELVNTDSEPQGEILGIKIENTAKPVKTARAISAKPKSLAQAEDKNISAETSTVISTNEDLNTDKNLELNQKNTGSDSSAVRWMIKKLLIICLLAAGATGLYLGFNHVMKKK